MFFDNPQVSSHKEECVVHRQGCPQLPGTLLRINIPAGAVINVLNLIELTSPSGICLIVRIPLLGGSCGGLGSIVDAIKNAGGTVEFVK